MKVTYIKLFKKAKENDEADGVMKFLREGEERRNKAKHAKTRNDIKLEREQSKGKEHQKAEASNKNIENKKQEKVDSKNEDKMPKFQSEIKALFNKKIVKKNQIVLTAIALMMVTAGYMNYSNNIKTAALGDAQLVSTNVLEENELVEAGALVENEGLSEEAAEQASVNVANENEEAENTENEETLETSSQEQTSEPNDDDYFTKTKLERGTMYSQMLETYQKILENDSIPADQKGIASNEIKNINDRKSAIATIENLIKIKGFDNVVILINDNSVNIVVKAEDNLTQEQVAQISNIVSRELNTEIEDIHITTHK